MERSRYEYLGSPSWTLCLVLFMCFPVMVFFVLFMVLFHNIIGGLFLHGVLAGSRTGIVCIPEFDGIDLTAYQSASDPALRLPGQVWRG